jgi:ribosomal protein S18 acetylase RimI-like enzyme
VGDLMMIERATLAETDLLYEMHEDVARWLWARGIHQWEPGELQRDRLIWHIARGETYLALHDGKPAGMVIVQDSDEITWGAQADDALYLHALCVRRQFSRRGVGRAILRWAELQVAARSRVYLRLDCMAENTKLRAYYEDAGFRSVGEKTWENDPFWRSSLYEKRVTATQAE